MSTVNDLDPSLQALLACKPPGVTKSKIASITTLCVENVKSESVLVQKIFTHFKKTPATHKLGVLYVLDSVTREWITKANAAGQDLGSSSVPDGTFAAGVARVTALLKPMMNDLIANAPADQKDKIAKLIGIWERGSIFPKDMLDGFNERLEAKSNEGNTRIQMPLAQAAAYDSKVLKEPEAPLASGSADVSGIQGTSFPQSVTTPTNKSVNGNSIAVGPATSAQVSTSTATNEQSSATPAPAPYHQPTNTLAQSTTIPASQAVPAPAAETDNASREVLMSYLSNYLPQQSLNDPQQLDAYLRVLQQLLDLGVPVEQWPDVLEALRDQNTKTQAPSAQINDKTQDIANSRQQILGVSSDRDRSRSPSRRDSLERNGTTHSLYRDRSPTKSGTPAHEADKISLHPPKFIDYDPSLPPDHIKVLSRTLFVGGVSCPDYELGQIFSRYGNVQSVIANDAKRHAFVKMCTRAESVAAKQGMDELQDEEILCRARTTKWGVGFGPRDCCDYTQGISVIPTARLTAADLRWILTAEYGGIGGRELTSGLVMEEPDIEIGAGVSSKAISNRVVGNDVNRRGRGGNTDRPMRTQPPPPQTYQQPQYHQPPPPMQFPSMHSVPPQMPFYSMPPQPHQGPRYENMGPMAMPPTPNYGFQMPGAYQGAPPNIGPYGR